MIPIEAGVVDVFVLRQAAAGLEVLTMQRAYGVRCAGAWEVVHGSIEANESAPDAALRECREETGCTAERLYSISANPFFVNTRGNVQIALVFAAFLAPSAQIVLSEEHQASEWLSLDAASTRLAWPREREMLEHIRILLGPGDAGPLEDVLRLK